MPLPTYASTSLPRSPLVDTWQPKELYTPPLATEMTGSNVRRRSQPGRARERVQFDIRYTQAQFATFKTFVKTTLNNGTSRYTMDIWMGSAFESHTVQFATDPQPKSEYPTILVTFDLYVF